MYVYYIDTILCNTIGAFFYYVKASRLHTNIFITYYYNNQHPRHSADTYFHVCLISHVMLFNEIFR